MRRLPKILLMEFWFFVWMPCLLAILFFTMGLLGIFIFLFLAFFWGWMLFTYLHYRVCRQEELLYVFQTAADTQAPIESILNAYLKDRPRGEGYNFWVSCLLTFVFPGYYWVHKQRSFDARLYQLTAMLQSGATLNQALHRVPGVVSREIALAVTVGDFSGDLPKALHRLPERRASMQWLEMAPRLAYPMFILAVLASSVSFMVIFIVPKFERIFMEFKMKLPYFTELMIACSRWATKYWFVLALAWIGALVLGDLLVLSSRVRWHTPLVGGLYRAYARGQFLHVLGLMLRTGLPLPEILGCVTESGLLPSAVQSRAHRLMRDLAQGEPLGKSLVRNGLATEHMLGLILTAEKANHLPWALQELGDSLTRRCTRTTHRITMLLFPLSVFACAILVGLVCVAMFDPLIAMLDSLGG
jgi:type II secretory pathway component PulF